MKSKLQLPEGFGMPLFHRPLIMTFTSLVITFSLCSQKPDPLNKNGLKNCEHKHHFRRVFCVTIITDFFPLVRFVFFKHSSSSVCTALDNDCAKICIMSPSCQGFII